MLQALHSRGVPSYKTSHIFYTNKIWTFIISSEAAFDALVPSLLVHLPHHLLHEKCDVEGWSILARAAFCNLKSKQKIPMLEHHMLLGNWREFETQFLSLYIYILISKLFLFYYSCFSG